MDGTVNKRAWECALLSAVRDELKAGNLYVMQSTHFGRFDNFFIPDGAWDTHRETFFKRAGLPVKTEEVSTFLEKRLNRAFDDFLELLPENTYVNINENGWQLSVDPAEKLEAAGQQRLEDLKACLSDNMRLIKLPELLIEVDNELYFTNHFIASGLRAMYGF